MGVIDSTTHTLTCACGATESVSLVQHGSEYGAGNWQSGKPFENFTAAWGEGSAFTGPSVASATCNKCGSTPSISIS
jgi:hypothetical protein